MFACFLILLAFQAFTFVNAGLYVVKPLQGSTCHAGKPCTVDWLDDGTHPLLTAIGVVNVGLYHGKQQLVQTIPAVNVATAHSLTFTPIAGAGPNADNYYISMISTSFLQNISQPYAAYSSFFRLEGMTGSFGAPDSAATSSISIPSSIATSGRPVPTVTVLSTITVGTISSASSTSTRSSSSSKPTHTSTFLQSLSASAAPIIVSHSTAPTSSVDLPIIAPTTLSIAPSGFSTLVSPPSTILPAIESLTSSPTLLPSARVANTTPNSATAYTVSKTITILIGIATLYLTLAF